MDTNSTIKPANRWTSRQALSVAAACLLLGITFGFLLRGSARAGQPTAKVARPGVRPAVGPADMAHVTRADVKRMVDTKAEPLLAELNRDPKNYDTLVQLAKLYYSAHLADEAIKYMELALQVKPHDTETRVHLGIVYFYTSRPDQALAEFQHVLQEDPNNDEALFNVGMILWQSKMDPARAIKAWNKLLATHPDHPKRAEVESLIARAREHGSVGGQPAQVQ